MHGRPLAQRNPLRPQAARASAVRRTAWLAGLMMVATVTGTFATPFAHAAAGSVTRFGSTLARDCFLAATDHRRSLEGLAACNTALAEEVLNDDDRAATLVNRGILKVLFEDFDGAQRDYNAAIALRPNLGEAYVDRGLMFVRQSGNEQRALDDITKGLELGTREPAVAYFGRALALEALGRVSEAYYDFKRAAELAPQWQAPVDELARFTVTRKPVDTPATE